MHPPPPLQLSADEKEEIKNALHSGTLKEISHGTRYGSFITYDPPFTVSRQERDELASAWVRKQTAATESFAANQSVTQAASLLQQTIRRTWELTLAGDMDISKHYGFTPDSTPPNPPPRPYPAESVIVDRRGVSGHFREQEVTPLGGSFETKGSPSAPGGMTQTITSRWRLGKVVSREFDFPFKTVESFHFSRPCKFCNGAIVLEGGTNLYHSEFWAEHNPRRQPHVSLLRFGVNLEAGDELQTVAALRVLLPQSSTRMVSNYWREHFLSRVRGREGDYPDMPFLLQQ